MVNVDVQQVSDEVRIKGEEVGFVVHFCVYLSIQTGGWRGRGWLHLLLLVIRSRHLGANEPIVALESPTTSLCSLQIGIAPWINGCQC